VYCAWQRKNNQEESKKIAAIKISMLTALKVKMVFFLFLPQQTFQDPQMKKIYIILEANWVNKSSLQAKR
jgi:hypothetical protein